MIPDHVEQYVKSATHFSLGRLAVKSRRSRSGARVAAGSGWVVKRFFALLAPWRPSARISRATWSRPTSRPARRARLGELAAPVHGVVRLPQLPQLGAQHSVTHR